VSVVYLTPVRDPNELY